MSSTRGMSGYRIRWTLLPLDNNNRNAVEQQHEELTLTERAEHVLTDLHKWSAYRIAVSAYNRAGEGPQATVIARTLEDVPGAVGPLQFRDILLDSVRVQWTAPV